MRKFLINFTDGEEQFEIAYWFVEGLDHSVEAQDFLPLLSPLVGQKVSQCSQEAQTYLLDIIGLEGIAPTDSLECIILSVEEV